MAANGIAEPTFYGNALRIGSGRSKRNGKRLGSNTPSSYNKPSGVKPSGSAVNGFRKEYMARPQKMRKVCAAPCKRRFGPLGEGVATCEVVQLTVDEYEVLRLIDYEGLLQEECAEKMQVARTTVQAMYGAARKKLGIMLVEGATLRIEGGNVRLCEGTDLHCHKKGCCRFQRHLEQLTTPATEEAEAPGVCPQKC